MAVAFAEHTCPDCLDTWSYRQRARPRRLVAYLDQCRCCYLVRASRHYAIKAGHGRPDAQDRPVALPARMARALVPVSLPADRKERLRHLDNLLWEVEEANLRETRPSAPVAEALRREGIRLPNGTPLGFKAVSQLFAKQVPYLRLTPRERLALRNGDEPEDEAG